MGSKLRLFTTMLFSKVHSPVRDLLCYVIAGLFVLLVWGCNTTKHVPDGKYLLRSNSLKVTSDQTVTHRGELKDGLSSLIIQKPNTYALGVFPWKLWLYNARYKHFNKDTSAIAAQTKLKVVERPVLYDSMLRVRAGINMRGYLRQQGYFYAKVKDTATLKDKKARTEFKVETGLRYLINDAIIDVDDSTILNLVTGSMKETVLKKGIPFSNTLTESERSRIANLLRNNGYYKFTQENIRFELDTVNKALLRNAENPFESAISFLAADQQVKKPTLDVLIFIRKNGEPNAYRRYKIARVKIYPDYKDTADIRDPGMLETVQDSVTFRYHDYYVHEGALLRQNFIHPGDYFTQDNYDRTITKLNDLGLFQYVRLVIGEDTTLPPEQNLRAIILLRPVKKYDFGVNLEFSNGSTYSLGYDATASWRNRNIFKGANQFSISLSGGIEYGYDTSKPQFINRFYQLSRNIGLTGIFTLPKFISPIDIKSIKGANQPRTILTLGYNLLERVDYFTLTSVAASFAYNWKESRYNTFDLSPAFVNILRLPHIADSFQKRLNNNEFLRNAYRENFIEGENLSYTFSDQDGPAASRQYSFFKASIEEAGGLLSGINAIGGKTLVNNWLNYSQYVKLDADARHYFRRPHSMLAVRLLAGVGIPYGQSTTLPYVRQYYAGGAYSIRGWRVRQLGPGSYVSNDTTTNNFIDRTGDIRLEGNAEYRFDIVQLFSGAIHLNGAVFADAGNIWLANPTPAYPGGEFAFNKLGQDIAVSTGVGTRLDIGGLFTIRFDVAFPIKKPYIPDNSGWVLNEVAPLKKDWRDKNLVLNIAVGLPF